MRIATVQHTPVRTCRWEAIWPATALLPGCTDAGMGRCAEGYASLGGGACTSRFAGWLPPGRSGAWSAGALRCCCGGGGSGCGGGGSGSGGAGASSSESDSTITSSSFVADPRLECAAAAAAACRSSSPSESSSSLSLPPPALHDTSA